MRAQIKELIRPAMLLAVVLVYASPSPAADSLDTFEAHSNQGRPLVAHTNQERGVPGDALLAGDLPWRYGLEPATAAWVPTSAPLDAGVSVPEAIGLPPASSVRMADLAERPRGRSGAIPAPGGLALLGLAVLGGRRRRRRPA
jgi:MYXO-CTERM domain-containing protein